MAGTLFSLGLSQRFDGEGNPLVNAPLYIYAAASSTPVDVYSDYGLTPALIHPWPMRTDSAGMLPAFWLEDGQYRARLTDEAGSVVYFDIPVIQAVGPSEGTGEGGGGSTVDPNAIFQTGDELWLKKSGTRTGWVRQNARTIGSAASGATERANADTQPLYEYLWNNFSNALCPVTGGRGANAAADFSANKPIATPDMRGRGPMGLDDMGNSAAGVIAGGTPTDAGTGSGSETQTLAEANLPAHTHEKGTLAITGAPSLSDNTEVLRGLGGGIGGTVGTSPVGFPSTLTPGLGTLAVTGSTASVGSGTAVNIMSPYRLGTWYLKL